jgi:hypothetical protein
VVGAGAVGERVGTTTRSSITGTCTWGTATGGEGIERVIRVIGRVVQVILRIDRVLRDIDRGARVILLIGRETLATVQERRLDLPRMFRRGQHRIRPQVARTTLGLMARERQLPSGPAVPHRKRPRTAENCAATQGQARTLRPHTATPFRDQEVGVRRVLAGNKAWDPGLAREGKLDKQ